MTVGISRLRARPASLRPRLRRIGAWAGPRLRRLPAALRGGYWAEFGLAAAILVSLVVVRLQLGGWVSADYWGYLKPWFEYLHLHGFHGLGDEFSNYNVPYLYLLFAASRITDDSLAAVKVIAALSDLALALGCFGLLRHFRLPREIALVAAAVTLLLPEVLMNSAAWGQADSTYGALLVWALWCALRGRQVGTWVLFALAFSFKLQAAFVLPAFLVLHITKRWGWRGPVLAVVTLVLTEIPAVIAGRSAASLAGIYFEQASTDATLTMNAPSIYALLPEAANDTLRPAGLYFALACVALLSYLVLRAARRRTLRPESVLLFVASLAMLAPYTLPMMHERYFYVGNVLLFVYALVTRRLLPWAFVAQAVAVSAYSAYLFASGPPLPLGQLALVEGAVLFVVIRQLIRETGAVPSPRPEEDPQDLPEAAGAGSGSPVAVAVR
jgi:Gpi18-like mannosyltransferase